MSLLIKLDIAEGWGGDVNVFRPCLAARASHSPVQRLIEADRAH